MEIIRFNQAMPAGDEKKKPFDYHYEKVCFMAFGP